MCGPQGRGGRAGEREGNRIDRWEYKLPWAAEGPCRGSVGAMPGRDRAPASLGRVGLGTGKGKGRPERAVPAPLTRLPSGLASAPARRPLRPAAAHRAWAGCVFGSRGPHGRHGSPGSRGAEGGRGQAQVDPARRWGQPALPERSSGAERGGGGRARAAGPPDPAEASGGSTGPAGGLVRSGPQPRGPAGGARLCGGLESSPPSQYLRVCRWVSACVSVPFDAPGV